MSIDLTISIGYRRKRPDTKGDRLEARMDSLGLFLVGVAVTLLILAWLVPKLISLIP